MESSVVIEVKSTYKDNVSSFMEKSIRRYEKMKGPIKEILNIGSKGIDLSLKDETDLSLDKARRKMGEFGDTIREFEVTASKGIDLSFHSSIGTYVDNTEKELSKLVAHEA